MQRSRRNQEGGIIELDSFEWFCLIFFGTAAIIGIVVVIYLILSWNGEGFTTLFQ